LVTLIVDNHIPFIKGVLEPFANVIYAKGGVIDHKLAQKADGLIIRTRTICDEKLLAGTNVQFIATGTIGFDHIDTGYCKTHGISWHHAPGCNSGSVMQYMASVLASLSVRQGYNFQGKKIGIVGVGHVGSKIARLAEIFGMVPVLNDPPRARSGSAGKFVTLEEICDTCDIMTFHVPLTDSGPDKTYHLADRSFFEKLVRKPLVINTSRGAVIETRAVKDALRNNRISAFVADVWENEPFPDPELLGMSLIATPHIAGYSVEGKANGTAACVNAACRHFGFGLSNWYPAQLPSAGQPDITLDCTSKTDEQVLAEAILRTYDVILDDICLRNAPEKFEHLRNHYPVRREFEAFSLRLENTGEYLKNKLKMLGLIVD